MFAAAIASPLALDIPTLCFVAVGLSGLLGLLLIVAWLQQRDARALAWWGAAYLIGASSMAMWGAPAPWFKLPETLALVACGVVWNGVRVFHGREVLPIGGLAGAMVWLAVSQSLALPVGGQARLAVAAAIVAGYTFVIGFELWRERRKTLFSRTAAVVLPGLHAAIFLMPIGMQALLPKRYADLWLTVFTLETMIYAVGSAFIVLLMVKDRDRQVLRNAASIDPLTGLLNRRAFLENANDLCVGEARRGRPVTLLMFDLDHFKSVNDRFGHAIGDEVLRVFAQVARTGMRANDVVGRLGGEEFAAIVPGGLDVAIIIGERIRAGMEASGAAVCGHAIGATVSVGAASVQAAAMEVGPLLLRADAALYRAKRDGRNRLFAAEAEPAAVGISLPVVDKDPAPRRHDRETKKGAPCGAPFEFASPNLVTCRRLGGMLRPSSTSRIRPDAGCARSGSPRSS